MTEIRPIQPEDIPGLMGLVARVDFPYRSHTGWHWALFENPQQAGFPAGFVAVRDKKVVGVVGFQVRDFIHQGTPVHCATGHTFITGPEGRGCGGPLALTAINHPGMAAVYSINNNARSAGLYKKIGMRAWLGAGGRRRMEWPVRPAAMWTGIGFSRLARHHDKLYDLLSARERFRSRAATLADIAADVLPAEEVLGPGNPADAELIDQFGKAVCDARTTAPVRTPAFYAYQASDPDAPGRTLLLAARGGGKLAGLMQVILTKPNAFEPAELEITDLEVHPAAARAETLADLVGKACKLAKTAGAARLRLLYAGRFSSDDLKKTGFRLARQYGHDPAHASFAPGMEGFAGTWQPTGFEGDFHFALRVAPQTKPG